MGEGMQSLWSKAEAKRLMAEEQEQTLIESRVGASRRRRPAALLAVGVAVLGVRHVRVIVGGRPQPQPNAWRLLLVRADRHVRWTEHIFTRQFRDDWWLNAVAQRLGRDPSLPPLTRTDGRRALRLMHEAIETMKEHR